MPISRCQIRNEYCLADPELYRAADKDDPEALLEGIAMAGLVGVLRQLGDLAEFAAEIFHDLHEEVMATAARGHGLMNRVQQLEVEFPSIEKVFLSQTNHSSFFTNTGIDWHPNLRTEQNLVTRGDLPRFVMDSYEECRGPPRLFLLDKFDVAGAGACLKRYTDPSFFKIEAASSGSRVARAEAHRERRIRKAKKKGTRWRNGETTPDIAPTHAKLHQLFLEERVENAYSDPARLVKLKKRQLNGFAVEAKTRKSYMEKFLETPSPDHKMVCETSIIPLPVKWVSDDASETGVRILEISTISPVKRSLGNESACSSPTVQEIELKPSSDMDRETDDLVKVHEQMDAGVMDEISSNHLDVPEETELAVHGQKKREGSIDGYHSDDATSEVDNYLDALTTMDSEMETDNEFRPKKSFLHIQKVTDTDGKEEHQELQSRFSDSQSFGDSYTSDGNSSFKRDRNEERTELQAQFSDSRSIGTSSTSDGNSSSKRDRNEEHMELQAHFSESQSIGNSSTSDEYSSFKKDRSSFSQADSLSTVVENIQSDGYVAPMLLSHTKYYVSEIEDAQSNQQTQMVGSQKTNSVGFNMHDDTDIREEEIPDSGQASSSSCLMTSDNIFLHSDPGATSSAVALSTGIQIDETPSDPVELHSRLSDDGDRDHVETMAAVPDALSLMKDDTCSAVSSENDPLNKLDDGDPHFNSDSLLQISNVLELAPEDQCNDHSVVTVLSAEPQNKNFSEIGSPGERSIYPSMGEVDLSPGTTLPFDGLDLKSEDCLVATQINLEDLSPVMETPSGSSFTRMHCSDLSHERTQDERDSAGVEVLYSDRQSNVEEISRMVHHDEISGSTYNVDAFEDDGCVEHPSSPDFVAQENHILVNDVVTEQVQLEDKTVSSVPSVDSAENQASIVTSPASGLISSPSRNLENSQETLPDSSDFHQMEMEPNKVESIEIVDLELEKRGNQLEPSSDMTSSNIISSPLSNVTYSQESHSTFMDPQEEIDVNEAVAGESLTELEAEKVVNQLEIASADVQSSPNRSLSCDPSDLEISNNIQPSASEEKIQYSTSVNDVTMMRGFSEMDTQELESKSLCQNDLFLNGKGAMSSSPYNHLESETPLEPFLPSQAGQRDAECLLTDEENLASEKLQSEQIQTSNELKQERSFHTASEPAPEIHLDQPSPLESSQSAGEEINPTKHVMDPVTPIVPDLFPKAAKANLEEMPPMPPLPPMQWRMGKVQHASLASQRESIEVSQASFQPTQPIGIDGKAQFGLLGSERETLQYQNPFLPVMAMEGDKLPHTSGFSVGVSGHPFAIPLQFPVMVNDANSQYNYLLLERSQIQNPFLTLPVISTGRPPHGYVVTSEGEVVQYSNPSSPMPPLESVPGHDSPQAKLIQPSSQLTIDTSSDQQSSSNGEAPLESASGHDSPREKLAQPSRPLRTDTSSEVKALQHSSSNGEGELGDPLLSSMSPPRMEAVQSHISLLPPAGEMALSSDTSALISMFEGENPNGKPQNKLSRPRTPLIDAVAAHDKSKLRKVTERVRPQTPPKEEERDSLLEQIRTKSFNLKPAVVTRPSMQRGPRTNLKVAAILEKANAIRQALAGSDEDDADSWSDS